MFQHKMEVGLTGVLGPTVLELANPCLETSLENTGLELVLILHQQMEAKTVKDLKKTWNCVTRISLVVSYDLIRIKHMN